MLEPIVSHSLFELSLGKFSNFVLVFNRKYSFLNGLRDTLRVHNVTILY